MPAPSQGRCTSANALEDPVPKGQQPIETEFGQHRNPLNLHLDTIGDILSQPVLSGMATMSHLIKIDGFPLRNTFNLIPRKLGID